MVTSHSIRYCHPTVADLDADHVPEPADPDKEPFGVPPVHHTCVCGFVIGPAYGGFTHLGSHSQGPNPDAIGWAGSGGRLYGLADYHDDEVYRQRAQVNPGAACPEGHGNPPACDEYRSAQSRA